MVLAFVGDSTTTNRFMPRSLSWFATFGREGKKGESGFQGNAERAIAAPGKVYGAGDSSESHLPMHRIFGRTLTPFLEERSVSRRRGRHPRARHMPDSRFVCRCSGSPCRQSSRPAENRFAGGPRSLSPTTVLPLSTVGRLKAQSFRIGFRQKRFQTLNTPFPDSFLIIASH